MGIAASQLYNESEVELRRTRLQSIDLELEIDSTRPSLLQKKAPSVYVNMLDSPIPHLSNQGHQDKVS